MSTELKITGTRDSDQKYRIEKIRLEHSSGLIGRLFGSGPNAAINICGLVAILLLVPGILLVFVKGKVEPMEYLKFAGPALTLILGYLFGKQT